MTKCSRDQTEAGSFRPLMSKNWSEQRLWLMVLDVNDETIRICCDSLLAPHTYITTAESRRFVAAAPSWWWRRTGDQIKNSLPVQSFSVGHTGFWLWLSLDFLNDVCLNGSNSDAKDSFFHLTVSENFFWTTEAWTLKESRWSALSKGCLTCRDLWYLVQLTNKRSGCHQKMLCVVELVDPCYRMFLLLLLVLNSNHDWRTH